MLRFKLGAPEYEQGAVLLTGEPSLLVNKENNKYIL